MFTFSIRKKIYCSLLAVVLLQTASNNVYAAANDKVVHVIAAENMYGNVAQQLGGNHVSVDSVLSNPDQDPHLFELTPSIGRKMGDADLVIKNGLGYDTWMDRLLEKHSAKEQTVISVQSLLNRKDGENPHLWYDIDAIDALSQKLQAIYTKLDPEEKPYFVNQLKNFETDLNKLKQRIQVIHQKYAHIKVAATEPVFGLMAKKLGFEMLEEPYQWVVMNGGEPTAKQVAQFIQDLKTHQIKILFYNDQVSTPATQQLKKTAIEAGIPVVGVSETMPTNLSYQQWMNQVLDKIENALKSIHQ